MPEIESITQAQLNMLVTHGDGFFHVWVKPKPSDPPKVMLRFVETGENIQKLLRLGLLEDASDELEAVDILKGLKKEDDREAYVMRLSPHGWVMFGDVANEKRLPN